MENSRLRILILSDEKDQRLYSENIKQMFSDVDLVVSCGDLPYYYLEYILDTLNKPMYFVHGNHDPEVEYGSKSQRRGPRGAKNLHTKVVHENGLILAGFEGSIRYSKALYQYTQSQVWFQVFRKVPRMLWNRLVHGRYLDILVTHSPAFEIGDETDKAHVGFRAYRWFIKTFKPRYHFHGHVHIYDVQSFSPESFQDTMVVNACPFRVVEVKVE